VVVVEFKVNEALSIPVIAALTSIVPLGDCIVVGS
jgi:hypothetical protein